MQITASPKLPPLARLVGYATFFATHKGLDLTDETPQEESLVLASWARPPFVRAWNAAPTQRARHP